MGQVCNPSSICNPSMDDDNEGGKRPVKRSPAVAVKVRGVDFSDIEKSPSSSPFNISCDDVENGKLKVDFDSSKNSEETITSVGSIGHKNKDRLQQLLKDAVEEAARLEGELSEKKKRVNEQTETLSQMKEQKFERVRDLKNEETRVANLKLQTELRERELIVARQHCEENFSRTVTLIEGRLLKFGKEGRMNPKEKWVQVRLFPTGQVVLDYAETFFSENFERNEIISVERGEKFLGGNSCPYEGRVFSICTSSSEKHKKMVFAVETRELCEHWIERIKRALDEKPSDDFNIEKEARRRMIEHTFTEHPLAFVVEMDANGEFFYVTSVENKELGLVDGLRLVSCNGENLEGRSEKYVLDILRFGIMPLTLRFSAGLEELKRLKSCGDKIKYTHSACATPSSMQELYPNYDSHDIMDHPIIKENPEFAHFIKHPDFKLLMEKLTNTPDELDVYLNKDL